MNVQLKDITVTARDGRVSHLDQVYIRGSHVRFFIVPDMLRNAPMFRSRGVKGRGVGLARGRATITGLLSGASTRLPTTNGSLGQILKMIREYLNGVGEQNIALISNLGHLAREQQSNKLAYLPDQWFHDLMNPEFNYEACTLSNPRTVTWLAVEYQSTGADLPVSSTFSPQVVIQHGDFTPEKDSSGLTGSTPAITSDTIAGTTHTWTVKTNYYTATIPIWLDEIVEPETWSQEFLAPEAREVLTALGAFIVCFRKPVDEESLKEVKTLLASVGEVIKEGCGFSWDGVCLAVALPQSSAPCLEMSFEDWDALCQDLGFEFVDFEATGRNEFSEPVGLERLKEALEANEWEGEDELGGEVNFDEFDGADSDEEIISGFGIEAAEMEMEMAGMKQAIYGKGLDDNEPKEGEGEEGDQDDEVEKLQAMMQKMQAVRDQSAGMPDAERKKFAAKAVNEIMKSL
ncbi:hypothetical protein BP5796_00466 [Coleophoma crateriformis]|uniref:Sm domain-containing protein n=1 Tax=Coleophoma crateriformis TaxID=565419 RepID=A0A3D8T803_9HELO|nr:hypothetical protein BP5796_00466 [Coleophoma crateriformis]